MITRSHLIGMAVGLLFAAGARAQYIYDPPPGGQTTVCTVCTVARLVIRWPEFTSATTCCDADMLVA
jgi:hypothetical protein